MAHKDWLVGADRRSEAAERIYDAALDLISRKGFENFSIDILAGKLHCSPATIYRNAGGKAAILEAVTMRVSTRVLDTIRRAIQGLDGHDRVVTAMVVGLDCIRSEPLGRIMMGSVQPDHDSQWLTSSSGVSALAEEIIGRVDPLAAQWLIRITLALWYWPVRDQETEYELIRQFVGPSFTTAV